MQDNEAWAVDQTTHTGVDASMVEDKVVNSDGSGNVSVTHADMLYRNKAVRGLWEGNWGDRGILSSL